MAFCARGEQGCTYACQDKQLAFDDRGRCSSGLSRAHQGVRGWASDGRPGGGALYIPVLCNAAGPLLFSFTAVFVTAAALRATFHLSAAVQCCGMSVLCAAPSCPAAIATRSITSYARQCLLCKKPAGRLREDEVEDEVEVVLVRVPHMSVSLNAALEPSSRPAKQGSWCQALFVFFNACAQRWFSSFHCLHGHSKGPAGCTFPLAMPALAPPTMPCFSYHVVHALTCVWAGSASSM